MEDDIKVYSYNWEIRKQPIETEKRDKIYSWCLDKESNPYLLKFEDEITTFDLKLPEVVGGKKVDWQVEHSKIINYINFRIRKHHNFGVKYHCKIHSYEFSYKKMLCLYEKDKKYPVLTLRLLNSAMMYQIKNFFKNPIIIKGATTVKAIYECLETDINITRRLLTRYNLKQCQWFKVKGLRCTKKNKVSHLDREYIIENTPIPIPYEKTKSWPGQPGVFTFDIETLVDNDFEWSNPAMYAHKIFSISCRYQRYQMGNPRIVNLILGEAVAPEGEEVQCYERERGLIEGFYDLVAETDPEILTGYNTYGFDNPYLWLRTKINRVKINSKASRLIYQDVFYKDNTWSSKGYGHKAINQIKMGGRIDIDVIFHVRANYKLKKNTLDFAARAILKKSKYDLPYRQMFADYYFYVRSRYLKDNISRVSNTSLLNFYRKTYTDVRDYLVETLRKTEKKEAENKKIGLFFEKIRNFIPFISVKERLEDMLEKDDVLVREMCELFNLVEPFNFYLKYKEKVDNFDPSVSLDQRKKEIAEFYEMGKEKINNIVRYNSVDTNLTYEIFEKVSLFTSNRELCNIVGINIEDVLNRGQQMRGVSTIYNECHPQGISINKVKLDGNIEFEGGFVFEPIKGLWDDVICIDFSSLYPSIIVGNNLCYSTFLPKDKWDSVAIKDCSVVKWTEKKSGIHREYRFVKKHIREGILPALLKKLLDGRYKVKAAMSKEVDLIIKGVLNKKQLAVKVCANSIYGLTGTKEDTGKLPFKPLSCSVTALGRKYIKMSAEWVEKKYNALVVYGDTDSIMFQIPGVKGGKACIEAGNRIAKEISDSKIYPDPIIKFEFEKAGRILTMVKKKYIYWKYDDHEKGKDGKPNPNYGNFADINGPFSMELRGIILVRRDNCKWYKKIYRNLLYDILLGKDITYAYKRLKVEVLRLLKNEIDPLDLVIYGSMGSVYKNKTYKIAMFRECLKKRDQFLSPGERFGYIVTKIKKPGKIYMGEKMRLIEEYNEAVRLGQKMEIDTEYYLDLITKNMDQLWNGYHNIVAPIKEKFDQIKYKRIIDGVMMYDETGRVDDLMKKYGGDRIKVFDELNIWIKGIDKNSAAGDKKLKKGVDNLRKRYISGMKLIKYDLHKPLTTISKAHKKFKSVMVLDRLGIMIA